MRTAARVALVTFLCIAGGSAYAYWQGGGTGSAQATSLASPAAITVSPATPTQKLLPGTTADAAATLTNSNPFPVHVSQLALDAAGGAGGWSSNASGCALSYATQTNGGSGWTVPASGSLPVNLSGAVSMGTAAASSCQGLRFTVYLRAS